MMHNAINEGGKGCQEALRQTFGEVTVVGTSGGEVFVTSLPDLVINCVAFKLVVIVVWEVVTTHFRQCQVDQSLFVAVTI